MQHRWLAALAPIVLLASAAPAAATVTVDNNGDAGPAGGDCTAAPNDCTLRQALAAASPHETVKIPGNLGPITVDRALRIDKPLVVRGAGLDRTVIDGGQSTRVLRIDVSGGVTLAGLQITGGGAITYRDHSGGAGIFNERGHLTLEDVRVARNHLAAVEPASPKAFQGGAGVYSAGPLTLRHSQVSENRLDATGGQTSIKGGGGILSLGSLEVERSDISQNAADVAGSALVGGIGLMHVGPERAEIVGTDIDFNQGSAGAGPDGAAGGGGLYDLKGGMKLVRSAVVGNRLEIEGSRRLGGAGIYEHAPGLTLVNTTVADNELHGAFHNQTTPRPPDVGGAGIYYHANGDLKLLSATIEGNRYAYLQGAILNNGTGHPQVQNTIVADNDGGWPNCYVVPGGGAFVSLGHNIDAGESCGFDARGDQQHTGAGLFFSGLWGGPVWTDPPGARNAVHTINHGDPDNCPKRDARGISRRQGRRCDVGAVEITVPEVRSRPPFSVDTTEATVAATVVSDIAGGADVRVRYGTTKAYGKHVDSNTPGGTDAAKVKLEGLEPDTTYHYRFMVSNLAGADAGPDQTFRTGRAAARASR